jgi:hypothetical protein
MVVAQPPIGRCAQSVSGHDLDDEARNRQPWLTACRRWPHDR